MAADNGVCLAHSMIERNLAECSSMLRELLAAQADKSHICGQNDMRLEALEKSDGKQWEILDNLRKFQWQFIGALLFGQFLVGLSVVFAVRIFFK